MDQNKSIKWDSLKSYIGKRAQVIGISVLYPVFLLYHAYQRQETPFWAKNIILASIAYFLSPFDAIPDLTPFLGFTDDLSVIMFGAVTIACYINEEVRSKARKTLEGFIPVDDPQLLKRIDEKL